MTHAISSAEILTMRRVLPVEDIAKRIGMQPSTVWSRLRNPEIGRHFHTPSERCRDLVAAYLKHGTLVAAASAMRVHPNAIWVALKRYEQITGEPLPRARRGVRGAGRQRQP